MPSRPVPTVLSAIVMFLVLSIGSLEAQRDSAIVVDLQQQADSAFTMVLEAFGQADIEVAIASADQGIVLSKPNRMGRDPQFAYAQYRADLEGLGPITRVTLTGILSLKEDLEGPVAVSSGSFFHGAVVWARLQQVGRDLRHM
jgi:hypothetical protein